MPEDRWLGFPAASRLITGPRTWHGRISDPANSLLRPTTPGFSISLSPGPRRTPATWSTRPSRCRGSSIRAIRSVNPAVVTTIKAYQQVTALSKGFTTTPLLVDPQFPPNSAPVSMPPGLSEMAFTQLVLTPAPVLIDAQGQPIIIPVRLQVKLKADTLGSDYSVPRLSHIVDALAEFTLAAMYKKSRQLNKADNCEQKGIAHIQAAVQIEKNQSEMRQQVVPIIYDSGDYLAEDFARVSSSYPWGW